MAAMSARSRRPTSKGSRVSGPSPCCTVRRVRMLSSKARASAAVSTGVLPVLREYLGPRTAWAGFNSRIWPVTSQSNRTRSAARCCLTVAGASWPCRS